MRIPSWVLPTGAGVFFVGTFTFFASLIFVYGYGVSAYFPNPYWQWWLYLWWYAGFDAGVDRWLLISAVPAAALPSAVIVRMLALYYRRPRPEQVLYGKTEWASRAERERGGFRETGGLDDT